MEQTKDRPYHHGDLRRAVIDTAMGMLAEEKGWQFTLREVARRAGVSHAAPYKHFPDKAALLNEMARLGFDMLKEAVTAAHGTRPLSVRDEFVVIARAYVEFGTANPALYRLMFGAETAGTGDVHLSESALGAFGLLTEFLEKGQRDGVLRKRDSRDQAAACWAQMHGVTMLSIDGLLLPEKVGPNPIEGALATLLDGLVEPGPGHLR